MNKRGKPDAAIFDLDGTLFQTEALLIPAYEAAFAQLRKEGLFHEETPPVERILGSLGMLLEQIWYNVMPQSSPAVHRRADELLMEYQLRGLEQGEGQLYAGVESTLRELKEQGIRLFIASNGLESYVKGVIHYKGLESLFDGVYSAGEYGTRSKVDLVKILMQTHRVDTAWMVGDRSSDVEAGVCNGLTVIGCDYAGFRQAGELDGADAVIRSFEQLLNHVNN